MIRKAVFSDIPAVAEIYRHILEKDAAGTPATGWIAGVYPTEETARAAFEADELFVAEENGTVVAAARINGEQVDVYVDGAWMYEAPAEQVMVLHTLVVEPKAAGQGWGRRFVAFYEEYAKSHGCSCLRMDTNAINLPARSLYKKLGYREAGIVPCVFNGIPDVQLVLLEKRLG